MDKSREPDRMGKGRKGYRSTNIEIGVLRDVTQRELRTVALHSSQFSIPLMKLYRIFASIYNMRQ